MTPLPHREQQVLEGIAAGLTKLEIGQQLYITEDTVRTYARRLYAKLGVHTQGHAVAVAYQLGYLKVSAVEQVAA